MTNKTKTIIGVLAGLVLVGVLVTAFSGSSSPSGPSDKQMQHLALKYWDKAAPELVQPGELSSCIYDQAKWKLGYKFTCFIFAKDQRQIGHIVIQALNSAGGQYPFEYVAYLN